MPQHEMTTTRATMKDVAALAGVSLKTVSRVINEESTVNATMVEKVLAAARELRYQPNFGASALRRTDRRSSQIAVLLEDLSNPFSAVIYRSIEEVATKEGFTVIGGSFDEDPSREPELVGTMIRHRVDGIVIAPASQEHAYLEIEQQAGTPIVFVDRPPVGLRADCVMSDSYAGSIEAVKHLASRGHRRIGYLGDLSTIITAQERFRGYRDALDELGLDCDPELMAKNLRTDEAAEAAVTKMLLSKNPPTALFTGQNLLTIAAVRALRAAGREDAVALIGFDDFLLADLLRPGVTVVAQDPWRIGQVAASLLFRRLRGERGPAERMIISTELRERGSGEIPVS
jgi:LacI family transcriptional regulator